MNPRRTQYSWVIGVIATVGGALGLLLAPEAGRAQTWCDSDMCSLDTGNCFNSHWDTTCREIVGGCEDATCDPEDPGT